MLFDYDIAKLIERSLLVNLRKPRFMAFVRACCRPLQVVHARLLDLRQELRDQYRYNGLKHSMEALLNDRYDPLNRGIYITVPGQFDLLWYQDVGEQAIAYYEETQTLSGFVWLDMGQVLIAQGYSYEFMVNVPATVPFDPAEMFALLDIYRYAGKRPAIRTFGYLDFTINLYLYPTI